MTFTEELWRTKANEYGISWEAFRTQYETNPLFHMAVSVHEEHRQRVREVLNEIDALEALHELNGSHPIKHYSEMIEERLNL